jgi:ATP synthase protein I
VLLPDRKQWQGLAALSALGIEIAAAVCIGALIGYWLDERFHTQPWLLLLFTGFGIAAAVKGVWRELKKFQQGQKKNGPGDFPSK